MLTTWVAASIQEAFYDAYHAENTCQAGLTSQALTVNGEHVYQRNFGLELLILQTKMRRAQAEIDLYTVAIENAHEFDCPTTSGFLVNIFSSTDGPLQANYHLLVGLFHHLDQTNCVTTRRIVIT
jgi:hypothetical protein